MILTTLEELEIIEHTESIPTEILRRVSYVSELLEKNERIQEKHEDLLYELSGLFEDLNEMLDSDDIDGLREALTRAYKEYV